MCIRICHKFRITDRSSVGDFLKEETIFEFIIHVIFCRRACHFFFRRERLGKVHIHFQTEVGITSASFHIENLNRMLFIRLCIVIRKNITQM